MGIGENHQGQPLGPPGRHDDPGGLPAWPAAAELVDLRWDQVDFATATLHVRRVKQGTPSTHPILGDELRACGGCSANRSRSRPSCSRRSGVRPSPPLASPAWSSGRAWRPSFGFKAPPAHAAARLRLRPGQQGPRHPGAASLSRAQEHPAHGALHRAFADPVQGFLARRRSRSKSIFGKQLAASMTGQQRSDNIQPGGFLQPGSRAWHQQRPCFYAVKSANTTETGFIDVAASQSRPG